MRLTTSTPSRSKEPKEVRTKLFGSKKAPPPPPPEPQEDAAAAHEAEVEAMLNRKEVELYPRAVQLLWHYYTPEDRGKPEGRAKEFPGPIDEVVNDCVRELEKANLIEVVPTFSDFGITAKLTALGLQVMDGQSQSGRLNSVEVVDPGTRAVTVFKEVKLGFP